VKIGLAAEVQSNKKKFMRSSETGSSIIPVLNQLEMPELTNHQVGDWKLWISGYKLDP
jgi:hypothetical protein